jgi:branched-chain amino acid transport system ATP-binding protein
MLKVEDLSVAYGGLHALSGVSLTVAEGQFVAIVGPNGPARRRCLRRFRGR